MNYFCIDSGGLYGASRWRDAFIDLTKNGFCADDEHIFALNLNFRDRSKEKVEDSLIHYINVVSRKVFGNKQRRKNVLIKHFAVVENHDNNGFHSHATISVDKNLLSAEDFKQILLEAYKSLDNKAWMSYGKGIVIVEYKSSGWDDYIHKNRTKEDTGYFGSISLSTLRVVDTSKGSKDKSLIL